MVKETAQAAAQGAVAPVPEGGNDEPAAKEDDVTLDLVYQTLLQVQKQQTSTDATVKSIQEQQKSTDATVKSIQDRLKGIEKDTKLLVEANPAAAKIPNVFVAGTKDTAQRKGAAATWTLVKAMKTSLYPQEQQQLQTSEPSADRSVACIPESPGQNVEDSEVDPYVSFS